MVFVLLSIVGVLCFAYQYKKCFHFELQVKKHRRDIFIYILLLFNIVLGAFILNTSNDKMWQTRAYIFIFNAMKFVHTANLIVIIYLKQTKDLL